MKYSTITVDYHIDDTNILVRNKPEMIAIYENLISGKKRLVSFAPNQGLANSICNALNEGYKRANAELENA